jgi:hypothetical protein
MERILPEAARAGIERMIEFAYSFEPVFAPTVILGKLVKISGNSECMCHAWLEMFAAEMRARALCIK